MDFEQTIFEYAKTHHLFEGVSRALLAVSGGVDSLVMLHVIKACGFLPYFEVLYCDHGFREPAEIQADQQAIQAVLEGSDIVFHIGVLSIDVSGQGVEAAAREARLVYYRQVMEASNLDAVFLAHHLDDLCETMMMQLSKGARSRLYGVLPKQSIDGISVHRPLLGVSKSEILDYARRQGISYSEDSTNGLPIYLRNRVRAELMPVLDDLFPEYRSAFSRFSSYMKERLDFEDRLLTPYWKAVSLYPGGLKCRLEELVDLDPFLKRQFLLRFIESVDAKLRLDATHLESILEVESTETHKKTFDLPGGIRFEVNSTVWTCYQPSEEVDCFEEQSLLIGQRYLSVKGAFSVELNEARALIKDLSSPLIEQIDAGKVQLSKLSVRYPRSNDMFWPLGAKKPVLLSDFLKKQGLLDLERRYTPLICSGDQIIWVCGVRISDSVKVDSTTKTFLSMSLQYLGSDT